LNDNDRVIFDFDFDIVVRSKSVFVNKSCDNPEDDIPYRITAEKISGAPVYGPYMSLKTTVTKCLNDNFYIVTRVDLVICSLGGVSKAD